MNKKGFTLVELLAVIVILAIILAIAVPTISGLINNSRQQAYQSSEKMLAKAAKLFVATDASYMPTNIGETKEVSFNVLKNNNYIGPIIDPATNLNCSGSVVIKRTSLEQVDYYPILSCGSNYETENYDKSGLIANYKLNGDANDATLLSSNGVVSGPIQGPDRKTDNLLFNGNFAIDTNADNKADGWNFGVATTFGLSNNIQTLTPTGTGNSINYTFNNIVGHQYYYSIDVKSSAVGPHLNNGYVVSAHLGSGNFERLSWLNTSTNTSAPHQGMYDSRSSGWTEMQLKNAQRYDLTDMFGAGKEPSKAWCDSNLVPNYTGAYFFDGIDDYIEMPDSQNLRMTSGGTISAWIYPRTLGENGYGRIVDKTTLTDGTNGYLFDVNTNNTIAFQAGSTAQITSSTNAITLNAWNHVAVTFDSSGRKLYANGVLVGSDATATLPPNVAGAVRIGNRAGATDRTFDGYIDDVRFYNRVLGATEIKNNYDIEK